MLSKEDELARLGSPRNARAFIFLAAPHYVMALIEIQVFLVVL